MGGDSEAAVLAARAAEARRAAAIKRSGIWVDPCEVFKDSGVLNAVDASRVGCYDCNKGRMTLSWNSCMYYLMDKPADSGPVDFARDFVSRLHPDDLDAVLEKFNEAVTSGGRWDQYFRVRWRDGTVLHIHGIGEHFNNATDGTVSFLGTLTDVTELKRLQERELEHVRLEEALLGKLRRNQEMHQLLRTVSHEIRNPLQAILANTEAMMDMLVTSGVPVKVEDCGSGGGRGGGGRSGASTPRDGCLYSREQCDSLADLAEEVHMCATHQSLVINEFLEFDELVLRGAAAAAAAPPRHERVDAAEVARAVAAMHASWAKGKGVSIVVNEHSCGDGATRGCSCSAGGAAQSGGGGGSAGGGGGGGSESSGGGAGSGGSGSRSSGGGSSGSGIGSAGEGGVGGSGSSGSASSGGDGVAASCDNGVALPNEGSVSGAHSSSGRNDGGGGGGSGSNGGSSSGSGSSGGGGSGSSGSSGGSGSGGGGDGGGSSSGGGHLVMTDKLAVHRILVNLVCNAVKFTERGSVTVDVWHEPAKGDGKEGADVELVLQVSDTGIGIPDSMKRQLFHTLGLTATNREYGSGAGLGLPICQALVHGLGGAIRVRDNAPRGTVMRVAIPCALCAAAPPPPAVAAAAAEASQAPAGQLCQCSTGAAQGQRPCMQGGTAAAAAAAAAAAVAAAAAAAEAAAETALQRCRILAAEDNRINQKVLTRMLAGACAELRMAGDGAEAVAAWDDSGPYGLLLLDIHMPRMGGREAALAIRARRGGDVPVIFLTGEVGLHLRQDLGANFAPCALLHKPASRSSLVEAAKALLMQYAASAPAAAAAAAEGGPKQPALAQQQGNAAATGTERARRGARELAPLSCVAPPPAFAQPLPPPPPPLQQQQRAGTVVDGSSEGAAAAAAAAERAPREASWYSSRASM